MTSAVGDAARSANHERRAPRAESSSRAALGLRVALPLAFLIGGIAIAFTATFHESVMFDAGLIGGVLVAAALGQMLLWAAERGTPRAVTLVCAMWSAVLAVAIISLGQLGLAWVIGSLTAVWALGSGVLSFLRMTFRRGRGIDALVLGVLGLGLALVLMLVLNDPVAIIGFFGAYCVMAGVYLGIAAFDRRPSMEQPRGGE